MIANNKQTTGYRSLLTNELKNHWTELPYRFAQGFLGLFVVTSFIAVIALSSYVIQITDGGKNPKPWEMFTSTLNLNNGNPYLKAGSGISIGQDKITVNANIDNSSIVLNSQNQLSAPKIQPGLGLNLRSAGQFFDVNVDQTSIIINGNNQLSSVQLKPGNALKLRNDGLTFDVQVDGSSVLLNSQNQISVPPPPVFSIADYSLISTKFANQSITASKLSNNCIARKNLALNIGNSGIYQTADGGLNAAVDGNTIVVDQNNNIAVRNGSISYIQLDQSITSQITQISQFSTNLDGLQAAVINDIGSVQQLQQSASLINNSLVTLAQQVSALTITAGAGVNITNNQINAQVDGTTINIDYATNSLKLTNPANYLQYNDAFGSILKYKPLSMAFGGASLWVETFAANGTGPYYSVPFGQLPSSGKMASQGYITMYVPIDVKQQYTLRANVTGALLPNSPITANGVYCSWVINTSSNYKNAANTRTSYVGGVCDAFLTYSSPTILQQITFIGLLATDTVIPAGSQINFRYFLV